MSLDVYSIRFANCSVVYPLLLVRPLGKFRPDNQAHLDNFLTDLCSNGCIIDAFVGDNQKRAIARLCKTHASYFPCEYCEAQGQLLSSEDPALKEKKIALQKQREDVLNRLHLAQEINDEDEEESLSILLKSLNDSIKAMNRKNNKIVWPSSTMNANERTIENITEISNKIDRGEVLSIEEAKGIKGRSLFLDIPYFNVTRDIPVEYLHGLCIGVVKRLTELTFNVGEARQRNTTRKLSSVDQFNKLIVLVLMPRESSRRARNLDFSVWKGQEFRNLTLFHFKIVLNCIQPDAGERKLWLLLAYMVRACVLPNNEYANIETNVVSECGKQFYVLYEELFSPHNCSYNTHAVLSHLPEIRVHGPLTLTSAFGFESFYGEMRHAFVPGTSSPLKQIMQQILIKRALSNHHCKPSIFYSPKDTALESNSCIYTFNDNEYEFFKILSIDDNSMHCAKFEKSETIFPETPTLNWSKVGVFEAGNMIDEMITLEKENVAGKFLKIDNLFITFPINVLEEK